MNSDDLHHGTIIAAEDQRHVLHRRTTAGGPAPTAMLASIPDDDDPDQNVSIRSIVVAVLWEAILEGEVHVLEYGPVPRPMLPAFRPSLEDLLREGSVFYGSKLPVRPRPRSKRQRTKAEV